MSNGAKARVRRRTIRYIFLVGAAAGWLLGGRAPSAVARQPLE